MSLFSSQSTWPANCSSAAQSPINLSQSTAKPCNLSCDLVMDDGYITQANVSVSDEGLILNNYSSLGSCKFRGETYVCQAIVINHPSHHTLEGVQADGEVVAVFRKPTGEILCVSSLFRVNPAQTPSYTFFKQVVPYAQTAGETKLALQNWSVSMMVPPTSSYYVYSGSTVVPPCTPCEWVVFKSMINMDTGDFAYLVRNVQAGSRSVQALGDREVFFNDIQNIPGGPMPHDNKFYLRLRPTGNTNMKGKLDVKKVDLKSNAKQTHADALAEAKNPTTFHGKGLKAINDQVDANGGIITTIGILIIFGLVIGGLVYGNRLANDSPLKFTIAQDAAIWVRNTLSWIYGKIMGFLPFMIPRRFVVPPTVAPAVAPAPA
jgi:carbonic anhydrase